MSNEDATKKAKELSPDGMPWAVYDSRTLSNNTRQNRQYNIGDGEVILGYGKTWEHAIAMAANFKRE